MNPDVDTLYRALAVAATATDEDDKPPPPDTIFTATIETIDNDRATSLLGGFGI